MTAVVATAAAEVIGQVECAATKSNEIKNSYGNAFAFEQIRAESKSIKNFPKNTHNKRHLKKKKSLNIDPPMPCPRISSCGARNKNGIHIPGLAFPLS